MKIFDTKVEEKRWKEHMKGFASYEKRNEDVLFNHNQTNQYCVATLKELEPQWAAFALEGLELQKHNIRKFTHKNKDYVAITINGANMEGTDGDTISRQAFVLNFLVAGYTYVFKKSAWEQVEKDFKKGTLGIKYINKKSEE